jgi:aminopeptidase N
MKTIFKFLILFLIFPGFSFAPWNYSRENHRSISDTLDALHYTIRLQVVDPLSHQISGNTEIALTPRVSGVSALTLELINLSVDSVFVGEENWTDYSHLDGTIAIQLVDPISPGDTVVTRIVYHGEPFHEGWGGFHFSSQNAYNLGVGFDSNPHNLGKAWFPCIDDFRDRATYDCHITVDDFNTAVCGGVLIGMVDHPDDTRTFHWQLEQTIPTYLASVAVGSYVLVSDTFEGLQGSIPITYYVRQQEVNNVAGSFVHIHDILHTFEDRFGPYSWPRIGYVSTALGAMEHATNIAYPYGSINGGLAYEWLYAHEVSHMWFGDKVTCASAEDMWLNEGWARYCESLYREGIYGKDSYTENINDMHAEVLQLCHTPSLQGDGQYYALYGIPPELTYGVTVYDKGGLVVHTLRGYLGDSLFFESVKGFLQEFAFQPMSSIELRDFLTAFTGTDMTDFFETWVFTPGFPHFAIESFQAVPSGDHFDVTVFVRQKYKGADALANSNRLEVTFLDDNRNRFTRLMEFSGQTGTYTWQFPFQPALVMLDPDDKICDATTDYSETIGIAGNYEFQRTFCSLEVQEVTDTAFVRITHHWVAPDSLQEAVPGLRLSDYRYWTIDGIFPEGFQAKGKFFYSKNNYLDNTLILSSSDSLVMLYRPAPGTDWQPVPFTKTGIWQVGNIYVENVQKGDYTLAVWDESVGTGHLPGSLLTPLHIYPNPSDSEVTFELNTDRNGRILVFDCRGKLSKVFIVPAGHSRIRWDTSPLAAGFYLVRLESDQNRVVDSKKIVLLN